MKKAILFLVALIMLLSTISLFISLYIGEMVTWQATTMAVSTLYFFENVEQYLKNKQ